MRKEGKNVGNDSVTEGRFYTEPPMTFYFQSMDGFALVLGADGRLLYVSETVSIYLGLSQVRFFLTHYLMYFSVSRRVSDCRGGRRAVAICT